MQTVIMKSQISAFVSSPVATDPPAVSFPGVVLPEPEFEFPPCAPVLEDVTVDVTGFFGGLGVTELITGFNVTVGLAVAGEVIVKDFSVGFGVTEHSGAVVGVDVTVSVGAGTILHSAETLPL